MFYFYFDREVNQKHGACVYYSSFSNWYYDVKNDDIWCEKFSLLIFQGKLSIKNSEPFSFTDNGKFIVGHRRRQTIVNIGN